MLHTSSMPHSFLASYLNVLDLESTTSMHSSVFHCRLISCLHRFSTVSFFTSALAFLCFDFFVGTSDFFVFLSVSLVIFWEISLKCSLASLILPLLPFDVEVLLGALNGVIVSLGGSDFNGSQGPSSPVASVLEGSAGSVETDSAI